LRITYEYRHMNCIWIWIDENDVPLVN